MAPPIGKALKYWQKWAFVVEIDGVKTAGFTKSSAIKQTIGIVEQREGGAIEVVDVSTSTVTNERITLSRGASNNNELALWWENIRAGHQDERNVSIVKQDGAGNELGRRNITGAKIASYEEGDFDGNNNNENAVETIELAWKRLSRKGD